jgi:hypothetical protein
MKTLFTLLMPLLMVVAFIASSKLFAKADYYSSAIFYIASFCAASLWVAIVSSKKLILR